MFLSRGRREAERLSLSAAQPGGPEKAHSSISRQFTAGTTRCQSGEGEKTTTHAPRRGPAGWTHRRMPATEENGTMEEVEQLKQALPPSDAADADNAMTGNAVSQDKT